MERKHNGSPDIAPLRSGLSKDFNRIREGSAATADELREFIQGLRGKSAQEVLGEVAQSGLAQGVVLSTLATFAILLTFTIIPYAMANPAAEKEKPAEATAQAQTESPPAAAAATPAAPAATANAAPLPTGAPPNAAEALEKLGETEVRQADPNKNPLDNLDNLLDKLE